MKTKILITAFISILSILLTNWAHAQSPTAGKNTAVHSSPSLHTQPITAQSNQDHQPQLINRIIAIVNNGVITQVELNHAVAQAKHQIALHGLTPPSQRILERKVLQNLILQKIAIQLAKLNHITVSPAQVDAAIASIASRNHLSLTKMKSALKEQGLDYQQYRKSIRQQMLVNQLEQKAVASSIMVTPSEIDNYLAQREKLGAPNKQYKVEHILLPLPLHPTPQSIQKTRQQANKIMTLLSGNMSFKQAALKFSQAPDAMEGGDLGWKTLNQLPTVFVQAVKNLKPGQIAGPIQNDTGFHIIKLVAVKNPPQQQHYIEQYQVQQILIKLSPIMNAAKAKNTLDNILMDLKNGEKFSTLAKAYNQNTATEASDGKMGWITLDQQSATFKKTLRALSVGQVSKPFQTQAGWQIIQLTDKRRKNDTDTWLRHQAAQALFEQKAKKAVDTWQAQIKGESYIKILIPALRNAQDS